MSKNETRQTIRRDPTNPEPHLDSGYEGDDTSDNFSIPACGLEDLDTSLFKLFDNDIGFTIRNVVSADKNIAVKKPFVIFATGERFALAKKLNPPRDKNKKLMLPAISVRRTGVTQTPDDITGRGINQFTGALTIKRKLAAEDKNYQSFINKLAIKNMTSLPEYNGIIGEEKNDVEIYNGGLLDPNLGNNVWEFITVPQPQFITATYEITFWTSYTQHMNYMIETYISSFLPQVRGHKLVSDKGYWFVSYTQDNFSNKDNFDDFTDDKRMLRYTFEVIVKGFVFATNHETNMVPIKRWISSPNIKFEAASSDNLITKKHLNEVIKDESNFILSDLQIDPKTKQNPTTNQRYSTTKKVWDSKKKKFINKTVTVLERNQKNGETVFYAEDLKTLQEFIDSINK